MQIERNKLSLGLTHDVTLKLILVFFSIKHLGGYDNIFKAEAGHFWGKYEGPLRAYRLETEH